MWRFKSSALDTAFKYAHLRLTSLANEQSSQLKAWIFLLPNNNNEIILVNLVVALNKLEISLNLDNISLRMHIEATFQMASRVVLKLTAINEDSILKVL
jgi:hypothetical protein